MSIIIPPGFAHIDMSFRHASYQRDAHVTMGVEIDSFPGAGAVAEEVLDAWMDTLNIRLDSNVTLRQVEATIGQDGGDPLVGIAINSTVGGASGNSVSPGQAVGIRKNSLLGGRRNSGRMFLPWFLPENNVDEVGIINPTTLDAIQVQATAFWAALVSAVSLSGMVILHRTGGSSVPPPTVVTSLQVDNVVSSQRRRQVRNP